jgi:hypothetical protein
MLQRLLISAALLFGAALAEAAPIELESADGPDKTCPQFRAAKPASLRRDEERVAFAICNAIDMARETATRMREFQAERQNTDNSFFSEIRTRLERILVRIRASRTALEAVKGEGPYFAVRPGEWLIDWDGDGRISDNEKYFLWVPKRGVDAFRPAQFASPAAYHEAQFVSPRIRVDRSDLLWAIAYCNFAEGALNLLLAYEVSADQRFEVRLKDPARVTKVAYKNILEGIKASAKLRETLQKETDDDDEWIPNPRQVKTSFPLLMDAQTFATWGELLGHMDKLFRGKTLLGGTPRSPEVQRVRDLAQGICPPGEGIDVQSLFTSPIKSPLAENGLKSRCRKPTAARPMTGLAQLMSDSAQRNAGRTPESFTGEWTILRHFYWVN